MVRKSDGEKIDELEKTVARIAERLDATIGSLAEVTARQRVSEIDGHDLRRTMELELAMLKRDLDDLKKWKDEQKREREEGSRRAWAFGPLVPGPVGVPAGLHALRLS